MNIILDTNTYSHFLAGKHEVIEKTSKAKIIYLSAITVGELLVGFKSGNRTQENKKRLEIFLSRQNVELVAIIQSTAQIFGDIRYILRKKGTPIPTNDVWIAANAIETGSLLITYDKHFLKIPGLRIWDELAS